MYTSLVKMNFSHEFRTELLPESGSKELKQGLILGAGGGIAPECTAMTTKDSVS